MAFPQVAATNGGGVTVNQTSHTVNLPSGISAGDLLLVFFANDGTATVSFPAGWTQLSSTTSNSTNRLSAYYRIADGSEGSTITVTTSASEMSAHTSYRITDYADTPEDTASATGTSSSPNPPSVSPSWGAEDTLWIAVCGHDDGTRTVTAAPTNYTDLLNNRGNTSQGVGVGSARRELNAASEDPGAFSISVSDDWVANLIAIRPSGAAAAEFEASVTCAVIAAGALTTEITAAGSATGAVSAQGALTTAIQCAGAAALSVAAAGDLLTEIRAAAAVTAEISAAGDMATEILLAGSAQLAVATQGALSTEIRLAGAVTLAITATGELESGAAQFAAAVTCTVVATGELATAITPAGAATCAVAASGALATEITLAAGVTLQILTAAALGGMLEATGRSYATSIRFRLASVTGIRFRTAAASGGSGAGRAAVTGIRYRQASVTGIAFKLGTTSDVEDNSG